MGKLQVGLICLWAVSASAQTNTLLVSTNAPDVDPGASVELRERSFYWYGLGFGLVAGGVAWTLKIIRQAGKESGYEF